MVRKMSGWEVCEVEVACGGVLGLETVRGEYLVSRRGWQWVYIHGLAVFVDEGRAGLVYEFLRRLSGM